MTTGVVIPTRGDRATFLNQSLYLLSRQTLKPTHVEVVDYPPENEEIDVAKRYKHGFEVLFRKGCDVVFCWEDDDYYSPVYLEVMLNRWIMHGKPDLFGLGNTVYYHVFTNRYIELSHNKGSRYQSSMFCTMVTRRVLELDLLKSDQYLDHYIWVKCKGQLRASLFTPQQNSTPLCLGIKHGTTIVAGGCHESTNRFYYDAHAKHDYNRDLLRKVTGHDFVFYSKSLFAFEYSKKTYQTDKPFLSIVTRCYKRPGGLSKNQESITCLTDIDIEQIFIVDKEGVGMLEANKSFGNVTNIIDGEYVFLLDDDDFITNPDMVKELKEIAGRENPDVIFFRMTIKNNMNGNYYPTTEQCWGNKPIIARIGGSCFVVKREVYRKFIHHFAHPRCGDFYFIDAVFNSGAKCYWHDVKMCETGKVSRGKPEVA